MKLFLVLVALAGGYLFVLLHTTNIVLAQTQQLSAVYQSAGNNAEAMAEGR